MADRNREWVWPVPSTTTLTSTCWMIPWVLWTPMWASTSSRKWSGTRDFCGTRFVFTVVPLVYMYLYLTVNKEFYVCIKFLLDLLGNIHPHKCLLYICTFLKWIKSVLLLIRNCLSGIASQPAIYEQNIMWSCFIALITKFQVPA